LFLFDSTSGTILGTYKEAGSLQGKLRAGSILIDSNDIAYVAMMSNAATWQVLAIKLSDMAAGSMTPLYYLRATTVPSQAQSLALDSAGFLYVGGFLRTSIDTKYYASLTQITASTGVV
jgi:hypothetical protein